MREGHLDHRYIGVENRIDPIAKGDISLDQMIGTGAMAQAETQDKIIEVIGLEETLEGIIGKIVERDIGMTIFRELRSHGRRNTFFPKVWQSQ